jgi:hypothetical protein
MSFSNTYSYKYDLDSDFAKALCALKEDIYQFKKSFPKEMTVKQIEELLGYEIKIIK